jgi:hypothetical protein
MYAIARRYQRGRCTQGCRLTGFGLTTTSGRGSGLPCTSGHGFGAQAGPPDGRSMPRIGRGLRTATWWGGGDGLALVLPAGSREPQTLKN